MAKRFIAIIAGVLLSTAFVSGDRQQPSAGGPARGGTEAAIQAVHLQMRQAAEKLDAEALYAFVLDTATPPIIEDGQMAPTRAAALRRTVAGLGALTSLSYAYTNHNITVLSPTTVLWVAEGTASGTLKDGRSVEAPFAETIVFVQREGQWKVLHAHRSSPNAR